MDDNRIKKIKFRDGQVIITTCSGNVATTEKETTIKSFDTPHQDFVDAVEALESHARKILGWSADYATGQLRITGVSFSLSEDTNVEGAVITGQVSLETCDAPFIFNTPHLPFDQYSPTGNAPTMPDAAQRALDALKVEAAAFVNGKRSQGDLFAGAAA